MKTLFHFHLIVISSVLLSVDSCKSKKSTTTDASSYSTPQQTNTTSSSATQTSTTTTAAVTPSTNNVRFVVSFYSIGQGIDGAAHDEFVKFLNSYPKKISFEPKHWGREGETDYCLALSELNSAEQTEFITKAKVILAKSKLVHQKENAQCDHVNWPPIPTPTTADDTYPLVVQFYSKGEGIDSKTNDAFVKFMDTYLKKISYEPTHWGREGEIDYCLKLSELSSTEQAEFIKKAKDLLAKSTLVHVNDNAKCVHKH
ncbi:MAG: hypothetical protein HY063_05675 [Bacteroidetes bacterium]|nr:hypothetical protein [Bacteroidota bacterium]